MTEAITVFETPPIHELAVFLAAYTSLLRGCGATCIRIEKNVARMAHAFDAEADVTMLPRHIQVSVEREGSHPVVIVRKTADCGISFEINVLLSRLSWEVADGKVSFEGAVRRSRSIEHTPPTNPWLVLLLASLANASFCRLFGGDPVAMAEVFLATIAGFGLKQFMLARKRDVRVVFVVCAFCSAVITAGAARLGLGHTPDIAMGTSVLYLIPGVPYINAVSDLLDRHYLSAFIRFVDAGVLTACLATGWCAAMFLFGVDNV